MFQGTIVILELRRAGFEYVCSHNETMLFRKRKWERATSHGKDQDRDL
jgi:hypothetical protein